MTPSCPNGAAILSDRRASTISPILRSAAATSAPIPVLIDLPFDVQMAEIEFDIKTDEPLPVYKPKATRAQIDKALAMMQEAERPLIVGGGGIVNADASKLLVEFARMRSMTLKHTLSLRRESTSPAGRRGGRHG
jgi:glyoxylate carboligase